MEDFEFNDKQKELIIGSLLGDGSLSKKAKKHYNSHFYERHSLAQLPYLRYKSKVLYPLAYTIRYETLHTFGKEHKSCKIQTSCHKLLSSLEDAWYKRDDNGNYILDRFGRRIKIIPEFNLTLYTLAIWYFDDGRNTPTKRNAHISVERELKDCEMLIDKMRYVGFHCIPAKTKNKLYEIVITSKSYLDFIECMSQYVPCEEMRYKVSLERYKHKIHIINETHHHSAKIKSKDIPIIFEMRSQGLTHQKIADKFSVTSAAISNILNHKTYKGVV